MLPHGNTTPRNWRKFECQFSRNVIFHSTPRKTHCKLWVCLFGWELEGTGADAGNMTIAQRTVSPTSELSSKARLPCACITGYATMPTNTAHFVSMITLQTIFSENIEFREKPRASQSIIYYLFCICHRSLSGIYTSMFTQKFNFFVKAPSFEAREAHRY